MEKRPDSRSKYINSHILLQEASISKKEEDKEKKIKDKYINQNSLSPSKLKKQNAFHVVPMSMFSEDLETYLTSYLGEISDLYRDIFVTSSNEMLKISQQFCETNILEIRNKSNEREGLTILYVNKVNWQLIWF